MADSIIIVHNDTKYTVNEAEKNNCKFTIKFGEKESCFNVESTNLEKNELQPNYVATYKGKQYKFVYEDPVYRLMDPNMFYQIIENDGIINVTESTERPAAIPPAATPPAADPVATSPAATPPAVAAVASMAPVADPVDNLINNDSLEDAIEQIDDKKEENEVEHQIKQLHITEQNENNRLVNEASSNEAPIAIPPAATPPLQYKALLLFDFDGTLINGHSGGWPLNGYKSKKFDIEQENLTKLNEKFNEYRHKQCKIIILTRCVEDQFIGFFEIMKNENKINFDISIDPNSDSVGVVAPVQKVYEAHNDKEHWAQWKAVQAGILANIFTCPTFFIDDTPENVSQMKNSNPNITSVDVTYGDYNQTFLEADNFLASLLPVEQVAPTVAINAPNPAPAPAPDSAPASASAILDPVVKVRQNMMKLAINMAQNKQAPLSKGGKQTKKHTKKLKLRTRRAGKPKGLLRVSRKKK
jgi:hypothetical protein